VYSLFERTPPRAGCSSEWGGAPESTTHPTFFWSTYTALLAVWELS